MPPTTKMSPLRINNQPVEYCSEKMLFPSIVESNLSHYLKTRVTFSSGRTQFANPESDSDPSQSKREKNAEDGATHLACHGWQELCDEENEEEAGRRCKQPDSRPARKDIRTN